jgi:hypothetical protein
VLGRCAPSSNRLSFSGIWFQIVAQSLGVSSVSDILDIFARAFSEAAKCVERVTGPFADLRG